ncbi:hypothetical protein [Immundisolibacter sp.]
MSSERGVIHQSPDRLYVDAPGFTQSRPIEDAGQHEVFNWTCLAGAMAALGQRPQVMDFVESWTFKSNMCFAVFPPG